MIKTISFDLDGTLADEKFDDMIWWQEIPRMYAEKHKISFKDAQDKIFAAYYRAEWIDKIKWYQWTDIEYWMKTHQLGDWKELITRFKSRIGVFDDVVSTLKQLRKKYRLLIISNANQKFLEVKLDALGLKKHFDYIFSAPSHFGIRKSKPVFKKILTELKLKPHELVHVGDDHDGDYLTPQELGIHSFHLLRGRKRKGKHELTSLRQLPESLKELS